MLGVFFENLDPNPSSVVYSVCGLTVSCYSSALYSLQDEYSLDFNATLSIDLIITSQSTTTECARYESSKQMTSVRSVSERCFGT